MCNGVRSEMKRALVPNMTSAGVCNVPPAFVQLGALRATRHVLQRIGGAYQLVRLCSVLGRGSKNHCLCQRQNCFI